MSLNQGKTGSELKAFAESILDDSINSTLFYTLLEVSKAKVESLRDWMILQKLDTSLVARSSDTYLTMKDLPDDFSHVIAPGIIYVDDLESRPIKMIDRESYRKDFGLYYIDYANRQLAIIGAPAEDKVITLPYIMESAVIDDSTKWIFPGRFHELLAFMVVGYITAGVDADDIYVRMSPEHKAAALGLLDAAISWDTKLLMASMGYSATPPNGGKGGRIEL